MQTIRKFLRPSKARSAASTRAVIEAGKITRMNTAQTLRTQLTAAEQEIQRLQTHLLGAALELDRAAKCFIAIADFEKFTERAGYYREHANASIAKTQQSERRKEQRRQNPAAGPRHAEQVRRVADRRA